MGHDFKFVSVRVLAMQVILREGTDCRLALDT